MPLERTSSTSVTWLSACSHTASSCSAMGSSGEMAARIEMRSGGKLLEELALAIVQHGGIHDLHDRVEVALAAAGFREPLLREPELAPGRGARRNLEVHGAVQGRHLHRG